jgi:hypothetical protein
VTRWVLTPLSAMCQQTSFKKPIQNQKVEMGGQKTGIAPRVHFALPLLKIAENVSFGSAF